MLHFEIGKFYKHASGKKIAILCEAETTMYGKTLVAEQSDSSDFMPVGFDSEDCWTEIEKDEWMECFSDE